MGFVLLLRPTAALLSEGGQLDIEADSSLISRTAIEIFRRFRSRCAYSGPHSPCQFAGASFMVGAAVALWGEASPRHSW